MHFLFVIVFVIVSIPTVFAQSQKQTNASLAQHTQWQHLLHYRSHSLFGEKISENDSDHFFVHKQGKTNPEAELRANIELFALTNQSDNESLQCRFPARYQWLKTYFPAWLDQPCSEFNDWKQTLDAHYLTLIFPASYLNSPSSMYGHTLIRLDRKDEAKSKLLSYSVNFAANADLTDNELVFTYKGLAGGYPGVVSVLPYYAKVNEYSHLEHRDVWEYRLDLTPAEVDQFVNHIWETQNTEFDYFFFDENCSYRLLALLDAASERIDTAKDFSLKAMPIDTIRSLIDTGKVASVEYRASSAVMLDQQQAQLNREQKEWAQSLALDPSLISQDQFRQLTPTQQAQSLEVAISYLRYLVVKKKQRSPENRQRSLALLSARSRIPVSNVFAPIEPPNVRDDEGHLTQRAAVYLGQQNTDEFVDLHMRIAYHELMDLPDGFIKGGQIEMGSMIIRAVNESTNDEDELALRLQNFSIINILSLGARDYFQQPLSWRVNAGFDRFIMESSDLFAHLDVAGGYSYDAQWDDQYLGQVYGLLETRLKASSQFNNDYQLSVGTQLGWLYQGSSWQLHGFTSYFPSVAGADFDYRDLSLALGYKLTRNAQLRFEAVRQVVQEDGDFLDGDRVKLGINWYF